MERYKKIFKEANKPITRISTSELFKRSITDKNEQEQFLKVIEDILEIFGDTYDLQDLQDSNEDITIVDKLNEFLKQNKFNGFKLKSIYEVDDPEKYYFTYNIRILNNSQFKKG